MIEEPLELTDQQRAQNRVTHHIMDGVCIRCQRSDGSPNIIGEVERMPCPTFVDYVLRLLTEARPYIVQADTRLLSDPRNCNDRPTLPRILLHKMDMLMRHHLPYQDDAFMLVFEDGDVWPEHYSGHGAAACAWKRWYALQDSWSVNLYRRIAGPHRNNIKETPVRK